MNEQKGKKERNERKRQISLFATQNRYFFPSYREGSFGKSFEKLKIINNANANKEGQNNWYLLWVSSCFFFLLCLIQLEQLIVLILLPSLPFYKLKWVDHLIPFWLQPPPPRDVGLRWAAALLSRVVLQRWFPNQKGPVRILHLTPPPKLVTPTVILRPHPPPPSTPPPVHASSKTPHPLSSFFLLLLPLLLFFFFVAACVGGWDGRLGGGGKADEFRRVGSFRPGGWRWGLLFHSPNVFFPAFLPVPGNNPCRNVVLCVYTRASWCWFGPL